MRKMNTDPQCRDNFILTYEIVGELIRRHHMQDRLHVVSYIHKGYGYYTIYLAQDPANPLSTAFGHFNASMGNYRSHDDEKVYYYFNDYKQGRELEEVVDKIEQMSGLPLSKRNGEAVEKNKTQPYVVGVLCLVEIIKRMPELAGGFAVENEICPHAGPYSKAPDNRLWFELQGVMGKHGKQIQQDRCIYDYFAIGTGAPLGPVYKAQGFVGNDALLYVDGKEPLALVQEYEKSKDYKKVAQTALDYMGIR